MKVKINYTHTYIHTYTHTYTHASKCILTQNGILGTYLHRIDTLTTLPTFFDKSEICNECFYLKTDELVYNNILEKSITYLMK